MKSTVNSQNSLWRSEKVKYPLLAIGAFGLTNFIGGITSQAGNIDDPNQEVSIGSLLGGQSAMAGPASRLASARPIPGGFGCTGQIQRQACGRAASKYFSDFMGSYSTLALVNKAMKTLKPKSEKNKTESQEILRSMSTSTLAIKITTEEVTNLFKDFVAKCTNDPNNWGKEGCKKEDRKRMCNGVINGMKNEFSTKVWNQIARPSINRLLKGVLPGKNGDKYRPFKKNCKARGK